MIIISPSILAADCSKLGEEISKVEKAGAAFLHIDIMDGHFVPNLTFGPHFVSSIRPVTDMKFDVHLMLKHPELFIDAFVKAGADSITFHVEGVENPAQILSEIRKCGIRSGIAIKPATDPEQVRALLPLCDMVLVMTVEPGFGNQTLLNHALDHIDRVYRMIQSTGKNIDIEVDGGVKPENVSLVAGHGANVIVAGSAVFRSPKPAQTVMLLQEQAEAAYCTLLSDD